MTRYFQRDMLAVLLLGFASGLPLALTASTLSIWLTESGVTKAAIGLFAAVATPYALKFLWAPIIDHIALPPLTTLFGRRRGWLFAVQIALALSIVALGYADPAVDAWRTALAALVVAFFSATQDIVIDAYRVELLPPEDQGTGSATIVLGYRFGMIASGAGALFLAAQYGWTFTYLCMALLVAVGTLGALIGGEPVNSRPVAAKASFRTMVIEPFTEFMTRDKWLVVLLFIVLYKFGDAFLGVMTNPFLIEIGFSKEQIATIVKGYGLIATIAGGFAGGWIVTKLGMVRSLWICGVAQAVTNLMFVVQARAGADLQVLGLTITLENFTGGMSTAAFVAYLSSLCNIRYTATQYALLSALASFGRTWLSTPAGLFAEKLGWEPFFILATLLALPGLVMLQLLTRKKKA